VKSRRVSDEDVYYCYRLFLKREPNEFEWSLWRALSAGQEFSLQWLMDNILYSPELTSLQDQAGSVQLIELEEMNIFIRPGDTAVGANIAYYKTWEPHVVQVLKPLLTPSAVFIDIGANIGYFSLLAAPLVGGQGTVMAFEPNPDNCFLLGQSIRANGYTNIHVQPYAVTERAETLGLFAPFPVSNGQIISLLEANGQKENVSHIIGSVALDDLIGDVERVDIIKMDIEGAEPQALRGMHRLLQIHRPTLITEFNPAAIEMTSHVTPESYLVRIKESGFDLFLLDSMGADSGIPQSIEAILSTYQQYQANYGVDHLELLAIPK
jgi:FkbM family methyltransferase